MILKKSELAALSVLASAEYESETAYFRALANAIQAMIQSRESYVVVFKWGGTQVVYGHAVGLTEAKKVARKALAALSHGATAHLVPVRPLADLEIREPESHPTAQCVSCRHPLFLHGGKHGCLTGTKWVGKRVVRANSCGCMEAAH